MEWRGRLKSPFRFSTISVSLLALLLYSAVFTAVFISDQTPGVPKDVGGLDLDGAFGDLHRVSSNIAMRP